MTLLGKHEERSGGSVQELVSGGESRRQDDGVDDVVENLDARKLDDDDKGRLSSVTGTLGVGAEQVLVISTNTETNHEQRQDVETDDSVEDGTDCGSHCFPWVLSLETDGGQTLHTTV